jgi:hypothetical protein
VRLRIIASLAALACGFAHEPARAAFIANRSSWNALTAEEKQWYLAGWSDHDTLLTEGPGTEFIALNEGIDKCVVNLLPRGDDLVRVVDESYARDVKSWASPPGIVFGTELSKLCRDYINRSRTEHGLKPFP